MSDNNKRRIIIFYYFMFSKLLLLCIGIHHSSMSDNSKRPACSIGTTLAKVYAIHGSPADRKKSDNPPPKDNKSETLPSDSL